MTLRQFSYVERMLSQERADELIALEKKNIDDRQHRLPPVGCCINIPLISVDETQDFIVDVNRKGRIKSSKCTYQTRVPDSSILLRLDCGGPPHKNPENKPPLPDLRQYQNIVIPCPHLHIYIEGYNTQWAVPVDYQHFPNTRNIHMTLQNFFKRCNVVQRPHIIYEELPDDD